MATVEEQREGQLCKELQFPLDQGRGYGGNGSCKDLTQRSIVTGTAVNRWQQQCPWCPDQFRPNTTVFAKRHLSCCSLTNPAGSSDSWSFKRTEEEQAEPTLQALQGLQGLQALACWDPNLARGNANLRIHCQPYCTQISSPFPPKWDWNNWYWRKMERSVLEQSNRVCAMREATHMLMSKDSPPEPNKGAGGARQGAAPTTLPRELGPSSAISSLRC